MAQNKKPSTQSKPTDGTAPDTTTLSIRLTKEEREILAQAAEHQDVSSTRFIKSASLTNAAHVVNTTEKREARFQEIGTKILKRLFGHVDLHYLQDLTGYSITTEWYEGPRGEGPAVEDVVYVNEEDGQEHSTIEEDPSFPAMTYNMVGCEKSNVAKVESAILASLPESMTEKEVQEICWKQISDYVSDAPIVKHSHEPMDAKDFEDLCEVVNLGGAEFLAKLLERARREYAHLGATQKKTDSKTQEPIDPNLFK